MAIATWSINTKQQSTGRCQQLFQSILSNATFWMTTITYSKDLKIHQFSKEIGHCRRKIKNFDYCPRIFTSNTSSLQLADSWFRKTTTSEFFSRYFSFKQSKFRSFVWRMSPLSKGKAKTINLSLFSNDFSKFPASNKTGIEERSLWLLMFETQTEKLRNNPKRHTTFYEEGHTFFTHEEKRTENARLKIRLTNT